MSNEQINYIANREKEIKEKTRILNLLDLTECINFAYTGSQASEKGKTNKGANSYKQWRMKKIRMLYPKDKKPITIWDKFKKSTRIN